MSPIDETEEANLVIEVEVGTLELGLDDLPKPVDWRAEGDIEYPAFEGVPWVRQGNLPGEGRERRVARSGEPRTMTRSGPAAAPEREASL